MTTVRGARVVLLSLLVVLAVTGAAGQPGVIDLALRAGRLPEDRRVVRVRQGDEVALRWTSDQPLTLHLHGYDVESRLAPGTPTVMRFTARATGRFPIEVHGGPAAGHVVGYLEVHPR